MDPPSGTASILILRQSSEGNIDMNEFISTACLEVRHVVYQLVMDEEQRLQWNDLAMRTGFYFNAAGSDPVEHFADCYSQFVVHPRVCARM